MKRLVLAVLALALAAPAARASENFKPFKVDVTVFGAYAKGDANAWGGGLALEPKWLVLDQLAVGLRLEEAIFVTADMSIPESDTEQVSVSQGVRVATTVLAKADYYLTTSGVRPFVGLGAGYYKIGGASQDVSAGGGSTTVVQKAEAFKGFGFAPQIGVNFGGFRLAGTYHVITGGDQVVVAQTVNGTVEKKLSKNYFAFEIGGSFGGRRRAAAVAPAMDAPVVTQ
jgi:outer membrane protein W